MPARLCKRTPAPQATGQYGAWLHLLIRNGLSPEWLHPKWFCMCKWLAKMRRHLPSRLRKNRACETRHAGPFHRRRTVSYRIQRAAFRGNLRSRARLAKPRDHGRGMKQCQTTPHSNAGPWRGVFASCVSFAGTLPSKWQAGSAWGLRYLSANRWIVVRGPRSKLGYLWNPSCHVSGATPHIADCTILSGLIGVETPSQGMLAAHHAAQQAIRVMEAQQKLPHREGHE
jgi:hypothetical protein